MDNLIKSILLGIVEGITEYLPISSTGHLLLCEQLLDLKKDPFWKMFAIFIQIGAILAVVVYFWQRILGLLTGRPGPSSHAIIDSGGRRSTSRTSPLLLVTVATIPVLVIGYLTHKYTEEHLMHPLPIALALGIGGLIMIFIDWLRPAPITNSIEEMTLLQAVGIGFAQVLAAVFPGTSRSAATIVGGLIGGLSREAALEFSFFLAIPAMFAATSYSLLKHMKQHAGLSANEALLLAIGTLVSFLVAWLVIAAFMKYVRRHNFLPFALYRIALAIVVLLLLKH